MIKYFLRFPTPANKRIEVRLKFIADTKTQELRMPAWIPGSYMIRDFAKNLIDFSAINSNDEKLKVQIKDKQSWKLHNCSGEVIISYHIYANDLSVRGAHLDHRHVYFNGAPVFLEVIGKADNRHQVEITKPLANYAQHWRVATNMPQLDVDGEGYGRYEVENYQSLIDYPFEIADFAQGDFKVWDKPHCIVLNGQQDCDIPRLGNDLEKVCTAQAELFGELPVTRYLFLITVLKEGYGGLEHRDCASLICKRDHLPHRSDTKITDEYMEFLGLCSHEYFHLWNVKRIRPERLEQADLSSEAYTEMLWAFEGITSYYDDLMLVRCGVIDTTDYLTLLAKVITRVERSLGRHIQSVAQSSFYSWTKFYKQDENAPNAIVSYYAKGALVAFCLDMEIRKRSQDRLSLDDLMRKLWKDYGKTNRGVPENGIQHAAETLLETSLDDFFTAYVYGTKELPLAQYFVDLGIDIRFRSQQSPTDVGGYAKDNQTNKTMTSMGAAFDAASFGVKVRFIYDNSPAQLAGLASGDLIVAINSLQVDLEGLLKILEQSKPEQRLKIHAFRHDELHQFDLLLQQAAEDTCEFRFIDEISDAQLHRRNLWLNTHA